MKIKIIKKSIKEGLDKNGNKYSIKSLFVSFTEEKIYDSIVDYLLSKGASEEQILKFCKPNEYNDNVSYAFGLNCSDFTFDIVQQFGVLDAKIIFAINDKGFIGAKIQVENKKEQVFSYKAPESNVDGWANGDSSVAESSEVPKDNKYNVNVASNESELPNNQEDNDLPF